MNPLVVLATSAFLRWYQGDGSADTLIAFRSFDGTHESMQPANLWADSLRTMRKFPRRDAGWDYGWAYRDDDWRSPLRYYVQIGARDGVGVMRWGKRSNDIISARAERAPKDTIYFLARRDVFATCFTAPIWSVDGFVNWSLAAGDSGRAEIVSLEYVNAIEQPHVCGELFQFWSPLVRTRVCPLRGGRVGSANR